jgi:parallel beta-helix repeat protein
MAGSGMQVNSDGGYPSSGILVENNIAFKNASSGFSLQGLNASRIVNNLIYGNTGQVGIGIAKGSTDNIFTGNTVIDAIGRPAVELENGGGNPARPANTGNSFDHNIMMGSGQGFSRPFGFFEVNPPKSSDNNIFSAGTSQYLFYDETNPPALYPNIITSDNVTFSQWQAAGFDLHSIVVEPAFDAGTYCVTAGTAASGYGYQCK